jgi:hypothetical protein
MSFHWAKQSRGGGSQRFVCLATLAVLSAMPAWAQRQEPAGPQNPLPNPSHQTAVPSNPQAAGTVSGKVIDQSGVSIAGATVKLSRGNPSISQEVLTDDDGQFSFANLTPGPFHLEISSPNLTAQTFDDVLQPEQAYTLPLVMLTVATQVTEVHVGITPEQEAVYEVKEEEKQRVFGFIPNYFVTYNPNPVPLPSKLKFHLALKSATDPVTIAGVAALAGVEQATNKWKEYGQGAQGYAKRFGASYADVAAGTFLGNAILPSLFKQDPRYFYAGPSHSTHSRIMRALGGAFMAKSDSSGKWEANYSDILGSMAAGGISNLYYPSNRRGLGLVFSTAAVRLGEITAANFFEEFFSAKFTPSVANQVTGQP